MIVVANYSYLLYLFIVVMAVASLYLGLLTRGGAIGAVLLGILTGMSFGWKGILLIAVFFGTSNGLGKLSKRKKQTEAEIVQKGDRRDFAQVLANGGVAIISASLYYGSREPLFLVTFISSMAVATADTWASEIGPHSKTEPIHLLQGRRVNAGTSGAVSIIGTLGALSGSAIVAVCAIFLWNDITWKDGIYITMIGFVGAMVDTLLGGSIQAKYKCEECLIQTEKLFHCGQKTRHYRGIRLINNDAVNFLSILIAALFAVFIM